MAGLTIKISADTQGAITQFNELGNSQNRFIKSLEDADKALGKANLDAFADKQALARAAITATRGETEALSSSVKAYQNKIESLIKQGISPENEEVKKLIQEEERLKKELEDTAAAHKLQENAAKGAAVALAAIAAAIAAATGAVIAGSVKAAAKVEDMRAAYTTLLGSQEKAAELVKRINTEAATTPFEIENISASMNKLLPLFKGDSDAAVKTFRMIGDTAGGNAQKLATLTDAYAKVQMKGKTSMMELNQISNAGVPIFDVLSQKFGVTTAELFEMSKNGDITAEHLTDAFKIMTSEGGVFFNGMENSSDTFNMRLLGLKENIGLVAAEIGAKFLPGLKDILGAALDAVTAFSEWIGEGDNLDKLLSTLGYALAGVTAGLAAFLVVAKGAAVIHALKAAFQALTGAMAANPIGAVAIAVTTVAVPAFIALAKHIDESQHKVRTLNKELETQKNIYSTAVTALDGLGKGKTLDAETTEKLVRLYPELIGKIEAYKTATEDATKMVVELDRAKKTDKINEMVAAYVKETEALQNQTEEVAAAERRLASVRQESTLYDSASMTLSALEKEFERMKQQAEQSRAAISIAYQGIGEELVAITNGQAITKPLEKLPEEAGKVGATGGTNAGNEYVKNFEKTLAEKLKNVKLTPEQDYAQDIAAFESYLNKMADMEDLSGEARVAAIESQEQRIRDSVKLTSDEERALTDATLAATTAARLDAAEAEIAIANAKAAAKKSLADDEKALFALHLENMGETEAQYQQETTDKFSKYLEDRTNAQFTADELDLEEQILQAEAKKEFLAQQLAEIQAMETFSDEEKLLAERALAEQIKKIDKDVTANKEILNAEELEAKKTLYSGMRDLLLAGLGDTREAAIAARLIASAEAEVNTALAATKALASAPPPFNIAAMAGVIAAGVAQQIKIYSTPIPSAETGGRFVVPHTATGVDSGLLRVNQDEVATITPRGGVSEGGARIIINLDGRPIVDLMNVNLRSGDIYEISPAWA